MKKGIFIMAATVFLCGCSEEEGTEMTLTDISSGVTESMTVTFARTEPPAVPPPETSQTEATTVLKENQLEYRDENVAVLMEFTGAESVLYYPHKMRSYHDSEKYYVLHSEFTVENLSGESFDFIPQKMVINGSRNGSKWGLGPVTSSCPGLVVADKYYTVTPGESVSFRIDFVGDKKCIENANEIVYDYTKNYGSSSNIDFADLNNVAAAGQFHMTKRTEINKAVSNALEITNNKPLPFRFVMTDGDYQVNTEKNSYCFTVERVCPEGYTSGYVRVSLKVAAMTGEAEVFEPLGFSLVRSDGVNSGPLYWSFDETLADDIRVHGEVTVNGASVTLYNNPFDLYLRPDGTAEYDMYFDYYEGIDYISFEYDGKNDSFEKELDVK